MSAIPTKAIETILTEASRIVDGDREQTYGHPSKNFEATARLWGVILGFPVSLEQVALMMVALKLARELHQPKRDNLVDMCGYLRCIEKMMDAGSNVRAPVLVLDPDLILAPSPQPEPGLEIANTGDGGSLTRQERDARLLEVLERHYRDTAR